MRAIRGLMLCTVIGFIGLAAEVSEAALAKKLGGAGFSGKLSSNKAIRKQQLIADPDDPDSGMNSVKYDPSIVTLSGLSFGPGYIGSGFVEVNNDGVLMLQDLTSFLTAPVGVETGYAQVNFTTLVTGNPTHGQIAVASGYTTVDQGGPKAVDTHAFIFDYLTGVADTTVATYTIYADAGGRGSGNRADFLAGHDANGGYTLGPSDIAPVTVRGSLVAVPVPPAVWAGGLTLVGAFAFTKLRRRVVA